MPVIELAYLPPVSWMSLWWNLPDLEIEACEHFQKGSYRNRCHIAGPNGVQRLSIPLYKGKHQQTPIREVRISYEIAWQRQHWRSIEAAYGNAPYFLHYADGLRPFYEKKQVYLFDFNLELLEWVLKKWGNTRVLRLTESYLPAGMLREDFRGRVDPQTPGSAPWFAPQPYSQVFQERFGFLPDLSALDLLFCCGKQGSSVLERSIKS